MKRFFFTIIFIIGIGILMVNGQNTPQKPDPIAPPTQKDNIPDQVEPDADDMEFPADVIDPTIDDTSEIPETRIDSLESKETKDTIRNNWDNSGLKKGGRKQFK